MSELPPREAACPSSVGPSPVEAPVAAAGPRARAVSTSAERELAAAGTADARLEITARLVATLAPPRPALEAAARSRVPERRRHREPGLPDLTRQPLAALGLVAPERAGMDLSPFLILVFLAAFVFAFADAAWRVRDGWWPTAAEPGRRRERPG